VIPATKFAGAFKSNDVAALFDNAQHRRVATGVGANGTQFVFSEVETTRAKSNAGFGIGDGRCQTIYIFIRKLEEMECNPLS
jgi:uncharacterized protein YcfJ